MEGASLNNGNRPKGWMSLRHRLTRSPDLTGIPNQSEMRQTFRKPRSKDGVPSSARLATASIEGTSSPRAAQLYLGLKALPQTEQKQNGRTPVRGPAAV